VHFLDRGRELSWGRRASGVPAGSVFFELYRVVGGSAGFFFFELYRALGNSADV
jgi:hypothetical protein